MESVLSDLPGEIPGIDPGMLLKHVLRLQVGLELKTLQIVDGFAEFPVKPFSFVLFALGAIVTITGERDSLDRQFHRFDKHRLLLEQMQILGASNCPPNPGERLLHGLKDPRCRHDEGDPLLHQGLQVGTGTESPVHDERRTGDTQCLKLLQGVVQGGYVDDTAGIQVIHEGDPPVSVDDQRHIHLGQMVTVSVMAVFEERDGRGVG